MEGVVADHLTKLAFYLSAQKQFFEYENVLFFWRGKREVDFTLRMNGRYLPIEVKYQHDIKRSDLYGVIDFGKGTGFKGGLILSKDKLQTKDKITVIPLALFLMLV